MAPKNAPANRIIAVIGATGTGKSQLAVNLATKFDGEVINCDAVQLYKGLPIITNKITSKEQKGVPHHLLGCIDLHEPTWTVGTFVTEALRIAKDIQARGKIPILVGGTHYYIQSLLTSNSLLVDKEESDVLAINEDDESYAILNEPTDIMYAKLREVDPLIAERWHPEERRKIRRSLEIWLKTGKKASDVYAEQKEKTQGETAPENPFNSLVFWTYAHKDSLAPRLHKRVLTMMESGLVNEVEQLSELQRKLEQGNDAMDFSKGIWISIGYKEFASYVTTVQQKRPEDEIEKIKNEDVERTQISTHQYAKSQLRWIRNKFLQALQRSNQPNVYLLDGSDLTTWNISVSDVAIRLANSFLNGLPLPDPLTIASPYEHELTPKGQDLSHNMENWQKKDCKDCGVVAVTPADWEKHCDSKRHKKRTAGLRKRAGLKSTLEI